MNKKQIWFLSITSILLFPIAVLALILLTITWVWDNIIYKDYISPIEMLKEIKNELSD